MAIICSAPGGQRDGTADAAAALMVSITYSGRSNSFDGAVSAVDGRQPVDVALNE